MIRGLAGFLSTDDRPVDPACLDVMLDAMGARADHRHGRYVSDRIVLGSGGATAGDWASHITTSGPQCFGDLRLDNRQDLARHLDCPDEDDAVLAHAFTRWGAFCAEHLHGDFALAAWDPRTSELTLARDRFGIRPLVYTSGAGWFAFASEVKALLALPQTLRNSSELRIGEFLTPRMPDVGTTMFDAIHRLPGGHRLTVTAEGIRQDPYWTWTLPAETGGADLPDRLAEIFTLAVARRVPDDVGVAVTLSGGLDSSSVAATMMRLNRPRNAPAPVSTYSLVFDNHPEVSERPYIEALVETGPFEPHFLDLDVEDPFVSFSDLLAQQDGLFLTPGLPMGRSLLEGLPRGTVVMDGHGGDEVISEGYERLHDLAERRQWLAFWAEAVGACRLTQSSPVEALATYYALYGRGGSWVRKILKRLGGSKSAKDIRFPLLSDRLADRMAQTLESQIAERAPQCSRDRHLEVLASPGQQHVLEILDRDASGRGQEARSPFWDEDLISFMLSVPSSEKLKGGRTRWIMREAMGDRLPDRIRWRRDKHDFNHHIVRGFRISPAASAERFERDRERLSRYMNLAAVAAARDRVLAPDGRPTGSDVSTLWRATAVAEWLDYADRNNIRIVE